MLSECATEIYGALIAERARQHDADWLGRFNANVWVPDELTHYTPYKALLLNLGFAEAEVDRDICETRAREIDQRSGYTPVHVTSYGMIQEYLADNWHGLIANMLRPTAPEAAYMVTRVKRRETLHTVWYRDMTALQLEAEPRFLRSMAEVVVGFRLPGNDLAPELQVHAERWLRLMGADFERVAADVVRLVYGTLNDVRPTGELLIEIAAQTGYSLGPVPLGVVAMATNRLGGPGYGLIGEALLERMGLDYIFRKQRERQDSGFTLYGGLYEQVRGLLRSWVAARLDLPDWG